MFLKGDILRGGILSAGIWKMDISAQNDGDLYAEAISHEDLNTSRSAEHLPPVKSSSPLAIPTLAVRKDGHLPQEYINLSKRRPKISHS